MATKKLKELDDEQVTTPSARSKKGAKTGTELAEFPPGEILTKPLPGEDVIDNALVSKAFDRIREITTAKGLETAKAIGEFLIETFFAGDLAKFIVVIRERPLLPIVHDYKQISAMLKRR